MAKTHYTVVSAEKLAEIKNKLTDKEDKAIIDSVIKLVHSWSDKTNIIVEIDAKLYSRLWKKILKQTK